MLPGTRSKESSKEGKKASPQFISYLKSTAELPNKSLSKSKENMYPRHHQVKEVKKEEKKQDGKVVEGNFQLISVSYVLDGSKLKKKQPYDEQRQQKETEKQNSGTVNRKQILKLEYLQKMGVLRPEEEEILKKHRKLNPPKQQEQKVEVEQVQFYNPGNKRSYFSPKALPPNKNLTACFSPKYERAHLN